MPDIPELLLCDLVQSYAPQSGGVKRYVHDKMRFFDTAPSVRHMLVVPGPQDMRSERKGGSVHHLASPPIPFGKGYRLLLSSRRIREVLLAHRPQVVEVDNPYLPAWTAAEVCKELGAASVGFYHSDFPRSLGDKLDTALRLHAVRPFDRLLTPAIQSCLRTIYNRMDVVVTATRQFQELLQSFGVEHVVRISLGTDTDVFSPVPKAREVLLRELQIPESTFLMLYVGRFAGMKNLLELIEAVRMLHEDPDISRPVLLVCIGEGEYAGKIEEAAEQPWVRRRPYLSDQAELARWYAGADLFVHAGDKETFGLVSVEAQACGTRVLAVRGGGMDATLEGEEPLIMAQSPAPEDLASALRQVMLLEPELEAGERARARRQRIRRRFSRESSFCKLLGLYRHLASGEPAASFVDGYAWAPPCADAARDVG